MKGWLRSRPPFHAEKFIYVSDGNKTPAEAIKLFRSQLENVVVIWLWIRYFMYHHLDGD